MSSMMKLFVVRKQKEFVDFAIKSIIDCSRLNVRYIRIVFIDFELNFFVDWDLLHHVRCLYVRNSSHFDGLVSNRNFQCIAREKKML